MSSVFLGIAGGSCSGKTTLVSYLTDHLSFNVSTLAFDSYYCDQGHLSLEQRALVNYDHPDSLDVDLFIDDLDLYKIKKNSVLIMAGGQGKRLRPLTEECPKPMILIKDIPILEIILLNCIEEGFIDFYFSVFYF